MLKRSVPPQVHVSGQSIMSIISGMGMIQSHALKLLATHGIEPLKSESWYPLEGTLKSYQAIFEKIGPVTLRAVGRKIPETAKFPPDINTLESALRSVDTAYQMNHRGQSGTEIGGYRYHPEGSRKGRMICDNLYPCELDMGIIEGIFKRFQPPGASWLTIKHDDGGCRLRGSLSCTYHLSW